MNKATESIDQLPGNPALVSKPKELQALIDIGAKKGTYKVEDFFRNPSKTHFKISPDGKHIAYLTPHHRRMNIRFYHIGTGKGRRLTTELDRDINSFVWINNSSIAYIKDKNGDENYSLFKVDISSESAPVELTPFANIKVQVIDRLEKEPNHILISMNKDNPQLFDVYKLDIRTGDLDLICANNPEMPISTWITDHDGKLRLAVAVNEGVNSTLLYRESEEMEFREVITTSFKTTIEPLLFDFEKQHSIYASSNLNRDKSAIVIFDLNTGKEVGDVIYAHTEVDVHSVSYSKKEKKIISYNYYTDKLHRHIVLESEQKMYDDLQSFIESHEIQIVSHDLDEKIYIIRSYSDVSLGSYYLYKKDTHEIKHLEKLGEWLEEREMSSMEPIQFQSSDNLTIHGYLTLPKKHMNKKIPLIVNPHGGPWVRDHWGFNPEVQLLAHHGYAVLQVNYRGSTGYGRNFWESSFKQWGQDMQRDISEAVRYVIKEYPIDSKRIAIYGGSYGGYATLAGLCYSSDLYKCGIDYVGVSNLLTFLNTIPPYWKPYLEMMYEMVGHPEEDKEILERYSPALNVEKIKTPLFVVQGAHDPRVHINESDQIVSALRSRNIIVPYMVKYDEGHGFRNEENRIQFYNAMIGFLHNNL